MFKHPCTSRFVNYVLKTSRTCSDQRSTQCEDLRTTDQLNLLQFRKETTTHVNVVVCSIGLRDTKKHVLEVNMRQLISLQLTPE